MDDSKEMTFPSDNTLYDLCREVNSERRALALLVFPAEDRDHVRLKGSTPEYEFLLEGTHHEVLTTLRGLL